jgi:Tol biopolymer transport system component
VVYASNRSDGRLVLYRKTVGGLGERDLLLVSDVARYPISWSPDGKLLSVQQGPDIWVLPLEDKQDAYPFLQTDAIELWGVFSPDGRWMAFESHESGQEEVYVTPFPGPGRKWQVSKNGGQRPWWRRDGREIVYQEPGGWVLAVKVEGAEDSFVVGEPTRLFETPPRSTLSPYYAPMPEFDRFLVIRMREEEDPGPLTLVLNWTAELER